MTSSHDATAEDKHLSLVITRKFDVPRRKLFKAWTDTEQIKQWMAPEGFTIPSVEGDARPGGAWSMTMRSKKTGELRLRGVYREIVESERLVFTHVWLDEAGKPGQETIVTVWFADENGKTRMNFRQTNFDNVEERDGHRGGWTECFDKLAKLVEGA
jgi:uncharacterized protein YndB with AHSA1/START domain